MQIELEAHKPYRDADGKTTGNIFLVSETHLKFEIFNLKCIFRVASAVK